LGRRPGSAARGPYFQSERERSTSAISSAKGRRLAVSTTAALALPLPREVVEVDDLICGRWTFDFANAEISRT
jgi:hypothetical protein